MLFEIASPAEKVGMIASLLGIVIAFIHTVRFFARFNEEHKQILEHLERTETMAERVATLEAGAIAAARERDELVDAVNGMRADLKELYLHLLRIRGAQDEGGRASQ